MGGGVKLPHTRRPS